MKRRNDFLKLCSKFALSVATIGVWSTAGCASSVYEVDCIDRYGSEAAQAHKGDECNTSDDGDSDCDCFSNDAEEARCRPDDRAATNADINPGAVEVPQNGVDDDCDGEVDELSEDNACVPGSTEACFPFATSPIGECSEGFRVCDSLGRWGDCVKASGPNPEICNGKDDDCDGVIDDNAAGDGSVCDTGQFGACGVGTRRCKFGQLECTRNTEPSAEICDKLDNDCDNQVDEGNPGGGVACSDKSRKGVCENGVKQCKNGALICEQTIFPTNETCNGLDDDCDGSVDEYAAQTGNSCNTGFNGACGIGVIQCTAGALNCKQTVFPTNETCNNKDDDCDGQVDEGVKNACGTCGAVPTEVCNAIDDDCDGKIDEDLPNCGLSIKCTSFSRNTTSSSAFTYQPGVASGANWIPIIEVRSVQSSADIDGGYQFTVSPSGDFAYSASGGNTSTTIAGRVCTLGFGTTTTGKLLASTVVGGSSTTSAAPTPPANPYQVGTVPFGLVVSDWSVNDNDFQWFWGGGPNSITLSASNGDSSNSVRLNHIQLSLPKAYNSTTKWFNTYNGTSTTLTFTDDPNLGANEFFVGILAYYTCSADRFGYNVTCNATSCTITASNGSSCSYVSGYITQLQWVDNI